MSARTNMLTLKTPEGVVFSTRLAGPVARFLAWGVDVLCIIAVVRVASILAALLGWINVDIANAVFVLVSFVGTIGYGIAMEWFWRGQTLGKKMFRLRVVDIGGMRLQFSQVVIRNLVRFVDSMPMFYVVGGLTCLLNRHGQRLGDIAANTVVVRVPKTQVPDVEQLLAGKFNSLHQYPHLEARLRQRVDPEEVDVAVRSLLRRDRLDSLARASLFKEMADHFRSLVEFPSEALDGITDEQYVRNVVDSVYRKRTAPETSRPEVPPSVTAESISASMSS